MRAMLRWIRADLQARLGQTLVAACVVAGVVACLLLSATLLEGATNPWRGLFAQTRGAHIWLHLSQGTSVSPIRALPDVAGLAGPYPAAAATLVTSGLTSPVELRAMPDRLPEIGRPLIRSGSWLGHGGVVLEASLAEAVRAGPGSWLTLEGLDGSLVRVRVTGVADTSDQGFYPAQTPGLIWVSPGLLRQVEPVAKHTEEVAGLRLTDQGATGFVVQQIATEYGGDVSVTTWRDVQQSMARGDPLLGLLLALFGLVALGAAVLAIANATGGRVLVQLQDLAVLKTLGFTPAQVVGMLLAEHAAVGGAGVAAGVGLAQLLTDPLLRGLPAAVLPAIAPLPWTWVALIAGGTEAAVLLATAVPGWRAARVLPLPSRVPAPAGRLSRLARVALLTHLPPAVVLGARAAFLRRTTAALTIGGMALPMLMITIGLGFWSTLDGVQRNPGDIGLAAPVTVAPGAMSVRDAQRVIAADPAVAAVYPSVRIDTLLPGENSAITALAIGGSRRPFPFHVAAGRIYRAPDQAVASEGLLTAAHLRIGEMIRITVGGVPVGLMITGRIIEPEYGGRVLAFGLDALSQAGAVAPRVSYSLVLRPGVSPVAARDQLLRMSGSQLQVTITPNPADQLGVMRVLLGGLIGVLALIGITNLITASAVALRDHLRDVGALRALGLTPRQVMASLVTRTGVLALIAAACGAAAGLAVSSWLIDSGGQAYGIGSGIASPPSAAATTLAVVAAVAAAAVAAVFPARQAARSPIAELLGPAAA